MQTAEVVLNVLRDRGRKGLPCTQLYRQMFNEDLYLMAYGNIYPNDGAMTPGVNEVGWPGGISPPGSHRSRRDTLASPGSYHLGHQEPETHSQWAKSRGCWRVIRFQHAWAFLKGRSRLYFLRIQRIR